MRRLLMILMLSFAAPAAAHADGLSPRDGWRVLDAPHAYAALLERVRDAIRAEKMGLVTEAGPTEAAASRGVTIPGNRVLGVFRNDFAVRALTASVPAMIEAPVRLYVTENADGTATLSWKTPTHVFAPYVATAEPDLAAVATELDAIFEAIAARAVAP